MTNKKLFFLAALINIIMMFLLVHKQNIIINKLYTIQKLQEQIDCLQQKHKELTLELHKNIHLSDIEKFAKTELQLKPITFADAQIIPRQTKES